MAKATINDELYRFDIIAHIRGECIRCRSRGNCVLIKLQSPVKKRVFVCHSCLIKDALHWIEMEKKMTEARERIERNRKKIRDNIARIKAEKKEGMKQLASVEQKHFSL